MAKLLSNFRTTFLLSILLAGVMIFAFGRIAPGGFDLGFAQAAFRWVHVVAGIAVLFTRGHVYAHEVLTFGLAGGLNAGDQQFTLMGIGVWLAIIMFLNVWGVIWPNQKRALGIIAVDDDKKAKAARIAMLGSRTNLLLSLPMLTSMAMYQTLFG